MSDDVSEPWDCEASVLDLTDTDLQASRSAQGIASDPSRELHRLTETYRRHAELDTRSGVLDRAVRVQTAAMLDDPDIETGFTRETYDVAYTIPPEGWVAEYVDTADPIPRIEEHEVADDDREIVFSTAPVVSEMYKRLADNHDQMYSGFVKAGVARLLGYELSES